LLVLRNTDGTVKHLEIIDIGWKRVDVRNDSIVGRSIVGPFDDVVVCILLDNVLLAILANRLASAILLEASWLIMKEKEKEECNCRGWSVCFSPNSYLQN
jgi:hypothetical protein